MSARIRFEDLHGNPLGYVDLKGKKLVGSNGLADAMITDWFLTDPDSNPQEFFSYYGDTKNSGGFLYSGLVDSETDDAKYPQD